MKTDKYFYLSLLLCVAVGLTGALLSKFIPMLGSVTLAIVAGVVLRNSLRLPDALSGGFAFAEKRLLPTAIALLGLELNFKLLSKLGLPVFIGLAVIMALSISGSYLLGRWFGFKRDFALLLGCGNAICGSSAIGATAPVLDVNEEDVGLSIGTVNLMGTFGLFAVPALASLLHLSNLEGGFLAGGSLQSVGQAVAAGFCISDDAGQIATVVKMGRVLLLGPVVLVLLFVKRSVNDASGKSGFKVPLFIIVFAVLAVLNGFEIVPGVLKTGLLYVSKYLLLTAMAAVGLRIHLKSLVKRGIGVVGLGLGLAGFQLCCDLGFALLVLK